jgi:hypothetical protein
MEYILDKRIQEKISKDFKESVKALHKFFANANDERFLQYLHGKLQHELKYMVEAHNESIENDNHGGDYL